MIGFVQVLGFWLWHNERLFDSALKLFEKMLERRNQI